MTRAERHAILGPLNLARIRRIVTAAPPPTPDIVAFLMPVFAPVVARRTRQEATQARTAA